MSDKQSRPFDAKADGLIMSEGYVCLVLKTLRKALADGDPVQAVVSGLGISTDGRGKSLWAPRKEGQLKALRRAYRDNSEIAKLQYVECHATSTALGDMTELETLQDFLSPAMAPGQRVALGGVKANIGHTLEAAGGAGLIKTVLCMRNGTLPPAIGIDRLNARFDGENIPYYVPRESTPWLASHDEQPRRAAVNAFGVGGLNMHVVVDEFKPSSSFTPAPNRILAAYTNGSIESTDAGSVDRAVAIIGIGCILPGANNVGELWETLATGRDPKSTAADARWSSTNETTGVSRALPIGGFVSDYRYDWRKHKLPPKQVAITDPLQFMMLEAAEQALADAGYDRRPYDAERVGVIIGSESGSDFCDQLETTLRLPVMRRELRGLLAEDGQSAEATAGIEDQFAAEMTKRWPALHDDNGSFTSCTLASRITRTLDLAGGAVAIDSGSTSAMNALVLGIDTLLAGDNDIMIIGAGQRRMSPSAYEALDGAGHLSRGAAPSSVLDASYDGVVPGEGVCVVVLKRLADARRDGDSIHAVIRGIAGAHHADTAEALRLAVEASSRAAGIASADVGLVEFDTDEVSSDTSAELAAVAQSHVPAMREHPLRLGSASAQFGHLGGAAPMLALLKACLQVEHGQVVAPFGVRHPALVFLRWASAIGFANQATPLTGKRLAAVASWSNGQAFHLILEPGVPVSIEPAATPAKAEDEPAEVTVVTPASADDRLDVSASHAGSGRRSIAPREPIALAPAAIAIAPVKVEPIRAKNAPAAESSPRKSPVNIVAEPSIWRICRFGAATREAILRQLDTALGNLGSAWRASPSRPFKASDDRFRLAIVADSARRSDANCCWRDRNWKSPRRVRCWSNPASSSTKCLANDRAWRSCFRAWRRNTTACCGNWSKNFPPRPTRCAKPRTP